MICLGGFEPSPLPPSRLFPHIFNISLKSEEEKTWMYIYVETHPQLFFLQHIFSYLKFNQFTLLFDKKRKKEGQHLMIEGVAVDLSSIFII